MKRSVLPAVFFAVLCLAAICGYARGSGTGTVSGLVQVHKAKVKTLGPKSFEDVVVYLEPAVPRAFPRPTEHAVMDQRGLVFIPHVMAVQSGTTVDFLNSDNDRHNVFFLYDNTGKTLDIGTWGPGQKVSHTLKEPGMVITLCQLHLEMAAYILVLKSPFFTAARIDIKTQQASYEIKGVPAGEYLLKAWHKKLKMKGGAVRVVVKAGNSLTKDIVITKAKYAK